MANDLQALFYSDIRSKAVPAGNTRGMCCLRHAFIKLTGLEAVFRRLKRFPGLRPVFHREEKSADTQLFITVLASRLRNSFVALHAVTRIS